MTTLTTCHKKLVKKKKGVPFFHQREILSWPDIDLTCARQDRCPGNLPTILSTTPSQRFSGFLASFLVQLRAQRHTIFHEEDWDSQSWTISPQCYESSPGKTKSVIFPGNLAHFQGCCLTGARAPGTPKLWVRASRSPSWRLNMEFSFPSSLSSDFNILKKSIKKSFTQ